MAAEAVAGRIGIHDLGPLRTESTVQVKAGRLHLVEDYTVGVSGKLRSPGVHWTGMAGPCLRSLHADPSLRSAVSALAGKAMFPTRAAYVHYEPGQHVGLHTDVPPCAFTLLVALTRDAGPLSVHPELADLSGEELLSVARRSEGHPDGGLEVEIGDGVVIRGSMIPHHRAACVRETTIMTLCFAPVL